MAKPKTNIVMTYIESPTICAWCGEPVVWPPPILVTSHVSLFPGAPKPLTTEFETDCYCKKCGLALMEAQAKGAKR